MKQLLIQLDDTTAALLEEIAPGRSHKRSEFLRAVIARAVHEALEQRTREAYERWPDEVPAFDAREWASEAEALHPRRKRASPRAPRGTKQR
jgi:hypothetical protein